MLSLLAACSKGNHGLRGSVEPSPDGKTYLSFDDDNGGRCSLLVDKQKWPYPLHTAGVVGAGKHLVDCGGEIEISISPATTFHFAYWGP
jgi:hypothetical protein